MAPRPSLRPTAAANDSHRDIGPSPTPTPLNIYALNLPQDLS